jgi:hypothetical protein
MDKDFLQYTYMRIDKALMENEEYKNLQSKCANASRKEKPKEYEELSGQMAAMEQELCYMQGFKDAMSLMLSAR